MVHQLRLRFSLCIDIWVGITIRYLAPTVCQVLNGPPEESHSQQFFRLGHGPILPKKTGWRWKFRFFFSHSSCLSDSYFVMKTLLPGYRIFGLPEATGDYFIGQSYAFLYLKYDLWHSYGIIFVITVTFRSHQIVPNVYTVLLLLPRNLAYS